MSPHANDQKSEKKVHDELMEKLKLDEEKEKKKLEKELKRRAELDKITKESFMRQALLLAPEKKAVVQPKKPIMKQSNTKSKSSKHNKQQNCATESIFNQGRSHESSASSSKREQLHNPGNRSSRSYFHEISASSSKREQLYNRGNKPSQSTFHENTWKKDESRNFQCRSRYSSVSDSMWSDSEEHFPALGAAAVSAPTVNIWEKRMSKQEEIKELQPQNEYDEEAMLQQAIALSLLEATEEEEKRKKMEEEYKMQMELLQIHPELVEDLDTSDEFVKTNSKPEVFDNLNDFQSTEKCEKEKFSGKCVSNFSQVKKTYSSGGTRPKINKVIDSFGGWGLKGNNSEKLSDFVDDVVNERSRKQIEKSNVTSDYQNSCKIEKVKSETVDLWGISDTDVKNSATIEESLGDQEEVLYDEKETFVDIDEKTDRDSANDTRNESTKLPDVSPNEVLDKWLSSDNIDEWNKEELLKEKQMSINGIQNNHNFIDVSSVSSKPVSDDLKDKDTSASLNNYSSNDFDNSVSKNASNEEYHSLLDSSSKIDESEKKSWSNIINDKQNKPLENISSLGKYNINDQSRDFSLFNESTQLPSLTDKSIWLDGPSSSSSYFSSFSDNQELSKTSDLDNQVETIEFDNDIKSKTFNMSLKNEADLPPILPPQPPSTMSVVNEDKTFTNLVSDSESKVIPPPISPPTSVPEMPLPQFPVMNNPVFNPVFPGISPVFGLGMDPILMRQMLMLSNPFFASQVLAMEHHYRSLGIPIDLFSVPTPMPNIAVPGMMGPSMMQNCDSNTMNPDISLDTSLSQDQFENNQFPNVAENSVNSFGKPSQTSGLDTVTGFNSVSSSLENGSDEPWYKSYLSNDSTAAIPPPKPPSNDISSNNLMSVSEPSKYNQSASKSNSTIANTCIPYDSTSQLPIAETQSCKPISAIEACISKVEVTGWGDPEDNSIDAHMSKATPWNDSWGDDPMPTKPVRNPSLYEDRKKTVCRQPAKQPQISRYQKSRTYN